jgi:putative transposase
MPRKSKYTEQDSAAQATRAGESAAEEVGRRSKSRQARAAGSARKKSLKPARKREIAKWTIEAIGIATKRACRLLALQRSTFYKKSTRRDETVLRLRLRDLAQARPRPRYGYRRLHILLQREGWHLGHNRVHRLYRLEGLTLRQRRKKKYAARIRTAPPKPLKPNERWSMDFVSDALSTGRRIRIFTLVDCYTRECLALHVEHSLPSRAVTAVLDTVIAERGAPGVITMDNGPEFTCNHFDTWAYTQKVNVDFIRPGHPTENGYIESFNGKFRDECLNASWFVSLAEARLAIEAWKKEYNEMRPHSSLGNIAPAVYAQRLLAPTLRVA